MQTRAAKHLLKQTNESIGQVVNRLRAASLTTQTYPPVRVDRCDIMSPCLLSGRVDSDLNDSRDSHAISLGAAVLQVSKQHASVLVPLFEVNDYHETSALQIFIGCMAHWQ